MPLGTRIFNLLFACRHRHVGPIITIQHQTYQVCMDCGARLRYSWQTMSSLDEREPFFRLLVLRAFEAAKQKILHAMLR
jgi:hypothetical protein